MFLKSVIIENFRCLKKVELQLNKTTVFIGENNSGKTACLEAIKTILGRMSTTAAFEEYDYYAEGNDSAPQSSEGISIKFIFSESQADEWHEDVINKFMSVIQPIHDDILNVDLNQIILCVTSKYNAATEQFEVAYNFLNDMGENLPPKTQYLIVDFLKYNPVFYLQALRDSADVFSGKSFMWGKFLKQIRIKPEELQEIQKSISSINEDIVSKDESLNALVSSMRDIEKVLDFNAEESVSVNAIPIKSWDLLSKAQVVLKNKDNLKFPLEKYGQGTQSMSIILLYEAYVNILLKQVYHKHAEAIFTLEEPEAHLHPQAIRALEKQLRHIESQKIITTHSPYFLQNVDMFDIRLFRKQNGVTTICSIPQNVSMLLTNKDETLEKIASVYAEVITLTERALIAKKEIPEPLENCLIGYFKKKSPELLTQACDFIKASKNLFSDEELNQLNTFVKQSRGELFFAKSWLMAEGQSETVILPYFAKTLGCDLDENGVSLIDYRSNGSAKSFVKLARILGFEWSLLADNDEQGEKTFSEIQKSGYSDADINTHARKTTGRDIEADLVNVFLSDYEVILKDEITDDLVSLKTSDIEAYKKKIIELIQDNKVENSYRLISRLEKRTMAPEEIPEGIKYLIERLCKNNG